MMLALANSLVTRGVFGYPPIQNIAFIGDSITDQGSTSLFSIAARGFYGWAQAFNGQKWEIEPNTSGSRLAFATSGATTATIRSNFLATVLATDADTVVWHTGQNDRTTGAMTALDAANGVRAVWAEIKAGGKRPIATTLTGLKGLLAGGRPWVLEFNGYIRTYAAADNVTLCDWATVNNTGGADDAVLDPAYTYDDIHPNAVGASRMGRVLAAALDSFLVDANDPFSGLTNVSPNPTWTGGPAPTSWTHSAGSGNTINSQSYDSASDPSKWWRIDHTQGTTNGSQVITFSDTISTYNGILFATILEIEVISGSLTTVRAVQYMQGGGTEARCLNQVDATSTNAQITSADGRVILRTPFTAGNGSTTNVYCDFVYTGTAVFRIRRLATWQAP
jgi:lysophospholipase L1-like esterase